MSHDNVASEATAHRLSVYRDPGAGAALPRDAKAHDEGQLFTAYREVFLEAKLRYL